MRPGPSSGKPATRIDAARRWAFVKYANLLERDPNRPASGASSPRRTFSRSSRCSPPLALQVNRACSTNSSASSRLASTGGRVGRRVTDRQVMGTGIASMLGIRTAASTRELQAKRVKGIESAIANVSRCVVAHTANFDKWQHSCTKSNVFPSKIVDKLDRSDTLRYCHDNGWTPPVARVDPSGMWSPLV